MLLCNKYSTVYTIAIYRVSNVMPYIVLLIQHHGLLTMFGILYIYHNMTPEIGTNWIAMSWMNFIGLSLFSSSLTPYMGDGYGVI